MKSNNNAAAIGCFALIAWFVASAALQAWMLHLALAWFLDFELAPWPCLGVVIVARSLMTPRKATDERREREIKAQYERDPWMAAKTFATALASDALTLLVVYAVHAWAM